MKLSNWISISAVALTSVFFSTAHADEVWKTEIGNVIYADEINEYAVLHFPTMRENVMGIAYIKDLAGNYDNRDHTFEGYWVEPIAGASTACEVGIVDAQGDTYRSWGRLKLIFTETAFPSGWVALRGECFDEPTDALVGKPIIGAIEIQETKFEAE
ncbi:hypothetical protein [Hirschia litorea]|uniref:DUF2147 domain-containing protein n=1 Tax=Hirschia litorea TaxID=1199156 RepID=A0ABW2ILN1_9PROT